METGGPILVFYDPFWVLLFKVMAALSLPNENALKPRCHEQVAGDPVLMGLRSENCMDKCERRVGHLMTCESFDPLKGMKSLHGCRRISRRFIGMFSFAQSSYKSKWFVEQFSVLIEALWCFLLALPGWLVSVYVCDSLSLIFSPFFECFARIQVQAASWYMQVSSSTSTQLKYRHMTYSFSTSNPNFRYNNKSWNGNMATWHESSDILWLQSCEKAGRLFFKSNLFWPGQWNNTRKTSRTSRIWWEFGGKMLETIMVLQVKEDGKNGPNTTLPFHVSWDSDGWRTCHRWCWCGCVGGRVNTDDAKAARTLRGARQPKTIFEEFVDAADLQGPFCQVTQSLAYFIDCYFFSLRLESPLIPFRGLKLVAALGRERLGWFVGFLMKSAAVMNMFPWADVDLCQPLEWN